MAFGSYRPKTLKLALNGEISLFHGQKFAISEFSRHIDYDFLKEDHKSNTMLQSLSKVIRDYQLFPNLPLGRRTNELTQANIDLAANSSVPDKQAEVN